MGSIVRGDVAETSQIVKPNTATPTQPQGQGEEKPKEEVDDKTDPDGKPASSKG